MLVARIPHFPGSCLHTPHLVDSLSHLVQRVAHLVLGAFRELAVQNLNDTNFAERRELEDHLLEVI